MLPAARLRELLAQEEDTRLEERENEKDGDERAAHKFRGTLPPRSTRRGLNVAHLG